jgi:hypothetical protein
LPATVGRAHCQRKCLVSQSLALEALPEQLSTKPAKSVVIEKAAKSAKAASAVKDARATRATKATKATKAVEGIKAVRRAKA